MKQFLARLTSFLLVTVALILIGHSLWNWFAGAALERALRQQAAQGLPMSLEEIVTTRIPAEDNAAPLLRQAFILINRLPLTELAAYHFGSSPSLDPRHDARRLTPEQIGHVRNVINDKRLLPIFFTLQQAADRPACRFAIDYSRGTSELVQVLAEMRRAVGLVCLRAWLRASEGDGAGALNDLLVAFRLANHLRSEPTLVALLVRIACDHKAYTCLNAVVDAMDPAALPAERMQALWAELDARRGSDRESLVTALDGERVLFGKWFYERLLSDRLRPDELTAMGMAAPPRLYLAHAGRPLAKSDYRSYLVAMSRYRELAELPFLEARAMASPAARVPDSSHLAKAILPALDGCLVRLAEHQALVELAQTGLALELHRVRHQAYPSALADMPESTGAVQDPFSGDPLVYRKTDGGVLAYSLGPNRHDDGGLACFDGGEIADLVWRVER